MRILLHTVFLLLLAPAAFAQDTLRATLDSAFLVKGEVTQLTLEIQTPNRPLDKPFAATNPDVTIRAMQNGARPGLTPSRQRVFAYTYTVQSFKEGTHEIPSFSITINGRQLRSAPIPIHVAAIGDLTYNTLTSEQTTIKYYSAIFTPSKPHYERESFPTEVKVYLPEQIGTTNGVVAELEHDGVVAWRFEAVPGTSSIVLPTGNHVGCTFRSTASSIRSGEVQLGPGRARIVLHIRRTEGVFSIVNRTPLNFDVPARTFSALPLPAGAPATFNGAVGAFTVRATADTDELEEGDPIAVRLSVSGSGNLDSLPAPVITGPPSEWKSYEPSRLERRDERRSASGTVSFSQIIRPLVRKDEVPPFELAYFDPRSARYETARSQPIPFKARPSTKTAPIGLPTPSLATPVRDMQDILGLVDPLRASAPTAAPAWLRYWHLLPALLGVALAVQLVRRRLLPMCKPSERERQITRALQLVERSESDRREFLRASGHFIERWIPPAERDEELTGLLEKRDTDCFRPGDLDNAVPANERRSVLRKLKTSALAAGNVLAVLIIFLSGWAHGTETGQLTIKQAEQAWDDGSFRVALDLYESLHPDEAPGADILYNIGNCHYRLSEPGKAALYYHRALLANPEHPEARQNLEYLERTLGSIVIVRAPYENTLAGLGRGTWRNTLFAGLWTTGLCLLGAFALSRTGRIVSWCGVGGGTLVAVLGTSALALYPDDGAFAPATERGIVTSADTINALTEASSAGKKVIEAPPGSLCRILAPRGSWSYVEFADRTRGWLPADQVTPLVEPPAPQTEQRP